MLSANLQISVENRPFEFLILCAREAIANRQEREPGFQGRIDVLMDSIDRTVSVVDNGTGMDALDMQQLVRTMRYAGRVEVTTRKPEDATGFRWTMLEDGSTSLIQNIHAPAGSTTKLYFSREMPWPDTNLFNQTLPGCAKAIQVRTFVNGKLAISFETTGTADEFAYETMPPQRAFEASVVYHARGRGKPLSYDATAND